MVRATPVIPRVAEGVEADVSPGAGTGRKRGRPGSGKPWEAAGLSRSAWFAKRKVASDV